MIQNRVHSGFVIHIPDQLRSGLRSDMISSEMRIGLKLTVSMQQ
jgi:hypothetical protein